MASKRKSDAALAVGLFMIMCVIGCGKNGDDTRPNVLLIVLDTARADRFSFTGYERPTTLKIDALAAEGTVFTKAFTTSYWTLPSHASLLTGLYPLQAGATSETNHLPGSNTTLAEIFQENGYATAAVVCNPWLTRERGFDQGFDDFHELWRKPPGPRADQRPGAKQRRALKKVLAWMDERSSSDDPFFLFVNFNGPHMPFDPPEPFFSRFLDKGIPKLRAIRLSRVTGMWPYLTGDRKFEEGDFGILSDLYDGEMAFVDHCVGRIADRLRALGLLDDTVLVITSDHGENLGDHGRIDHILSMHETTLHIPLVIRHPETFQPGARKDGLVSLVDVAPTIFDACRIPYADGSFDAEAISLCQDETQGRTFVVAENERPLNGITLLEHNCPSFDTAAIDYRMRAIRTKDHKLIWSLGRKTELFDLKIDPKEEHDRAAEDDSNRTRLQEMLKGWMQERSGKPAPPRLTSEDAENLKTLKSLGYMDGDIKDSPE